jgi:hypothetical protein
MSAEPTVRAALVSSKNRRSASKWLVSCGPSSALTRISAVGLIIGVAGCTTPVPYAQAAWVPQSRILDQRWLAPSQGSGKLIVTRDSGLYGSGCAIRLFVDGAEVADFVPAERIELFLPVGEHILSAKPRGLICVGTFETSVVIAPDGQKAYRMAVGANGDIHIQPTAF